jgi:hypothetical protein
MKGKLFKVSGVSCLRTPKSFLKNLLYLSTSYIESDLRKWYKRLAYQAEVNKKQMRILLIVINFCHKSFFDQNINVHLTFDKILPVHVLLIYLSQTT